MQIESNCFPDNTVAFTTFLLVYLITFKIEFKFAFLLVNREIHFPNIFMSSTNLIE